MWRLYSTSLLTGQSFPCSRTDCDIPDTMEGDPTFTDWWEDKRAYLRVAFPYWKYSWKKCDRT